MVFAILIKLDGPGPVFLIERIIGRRFRPFKILRFRTEGTRLGRFVRRTKFDKLPQLLNVIRGDMGIIGPWPVIEKYAIKFREDFDEIFKLRPGIIDVTALNYSDEMILKDKKDPEDYYVHILLPEKIKLAKDYVKKASVMYDMELVFLAYFKQVFLRVQYYINRIIKVVTPVRRPIVIGIQILAVIICSYAAFFIRFDGDIPSYEYALFFKYLPLLIVIRAIFLFMFSLDTGLWRYVSTKDLISIVSATTFGSVMFYITAVGSFEATAYPRSIFVIDWLLNIILLSGLRLVRRFNEVKVESKNVSNVRVIIIGAGDATDMLLRDIEHNPIYSFKVVGLIDDVPAKKGNKIRNIPVLGTRKDLPSIVKSTKPDEFLIAIPSASHTHIREITQDLRQFGLPIKTIPSLWGILNGSAALNQIQLIEPEDVLFRAPVNFRDVDLKTFVSGRRVMITGAGGSIGSELSRQIASLGPESLVLFEKHEESLFKINMELGSAKSVSGLYPIIGDVTDELRVSEIMEQFRPQVIFHAAAYKHVPLMENSPFEAFKTNVIGSKIMAEKAMEYDAERFIIISTDKAVNPVNVMGMTKKIAEEVVRSFSLQNNGFSNYTKYMIVRFGNVLDSSGSVVPIFREQIKRGGPVTVTHPDMTRYFMTIPEAVNLVLQAAEMGNGGEVLVLDMGEPVKILDLAKKMISIYGYKPGIDIGIDFTGLRPGEKLHEDLFNTYERVEKTSNSRINISLSHRIVSSDIVDLVMDYYNTKLTRGKADLMDICNKLIQDKREFNRYSMNFSFSLSLNGNGSRVKSTIIDIGVGGFSTKLGESVILEEQMQVQLSLQDNGRGDTWFSHAEIAWSKRDGDSYIYGFKFIYTDSGKKNILEELLNSREGRKLDIPSLSKLR